MRAHASHVAGAQRACASMDGPLGGPTIGGGHRWLAIAPGRPVTSLRRRRPPRTRNTFQRILPQLLEKALFVEMHDFLGCAVFYR